MPTQKLTNEILAAAIEGFEAQKMRIDGQIAELRRMLTGGSAEVPATPRPKQGNRKLSAAARKRIGDAQRKRWAATRKESQQLQPDTPKAKRKLSAAGRKRIVEATKKRWARIRAEKAAKAQQAPAAKKVVREAPARAAKKRVAAKRPAGTKAAAAVPTQTTA